MWHKKLDLAKSSHNFGALFYRRCSRYMHASMPRLEQGNVPKKGAIYRTRRTFLFLSHSTSYRSFDSWSKTRSLTHWIDLEVRSFFDGWLGSSFPCRDERKKESRTSHWRNGFTKRKNEAQFLYLFGGDYAGMSFLTHEPKERTNERCRFLSTTHRDASLF